ncbi:predicted protein [Naegleria gruberi]|uniref:Predicted protein n=1 Tax=Naegleria gruberi TaxID=5762 RepID=D2V6B4_NAEGR|nr:uncharacterized protein NAEGRDRAFT_64376 [Naegleria gruberi]EFC47418.1 predicted protein [Naegleria gruberi]|eukprot:XP_002680162.1 predicted protein [Naegleria gruberi strain NEG-M]
MKGPRFYYDYSYRMRPRIFPRFFFGMLVGGFVGYAWGRNNNCNQSHQNHFGPFCGSRDRHNGWDNRNSYNPNHQQAFNNQTYPTQYTTQQNNNLNNIILKMVNLNIFKYYNNLPIQLLVIIQ